MGHSHLTPAHLTQRTHFRLSVDAPKTPSRRTPRSAGLREVGSTMCDPHVVSIIPLSPLQLLMILGNHRDSRNDWTSRPIRHPQPCPAVARVGSQLGGTGASVEAQTSASPASCPLAPACSALPGPGSQGATWLHPHLEGTLGLSWMPAPQVSMC